MTYRGEEGKQGGHRVSSPLEGISQELEELELQAAAERYEAISKFLETVEEVEEDQEDDEYDEYDE